MSTSISDHDLVLNRLLDAPRSSVWRCWTEPDLLKQWFTPAPWKTIEADLDLRPSGKFNFVMQSPEGEKFPNHGVFLEVVEQEKLVFTDAFSAGWVPAEKPFMTAIVTFADEGGKTRYRARARHWTEEARKQHEEMGFHDGWGKAADQLEALARTI